VSSVYAILNDVIIVKSLIPKVRTSYQLYYVIAIAK